MSIHVFVDNSNLYGGAQRACETLEPNIPCRAIRIHYKNFFKLIQGQREIKTAILTGSSNSASEDLWQYAQESRYQIKLMQRINDKGNMREQGVDELIHLDIALTLLDYDPPQTLVLVTGDGKSSEYNHGFPGLVERALKRGWDIEVWSFSKVCHSCYSRMVTGSNNRMKLFILDKWYKSITFVQHGRYYYIDPTSNFKVYVNVQNRSAEYLLLETPRRGLLHLKGHV